MSRPTRLLALSAVLAGLLAAAAGCGGGTTSIQSSPATTNEGLYLELGGLKYQVQISRFLNPADREDSAYFKGLPQGTSLGNDEVYFGVFMRVENDGDKQASATSQYTITDTQDNTFRPVPLDTKINPFAYRPQPVPPQAVLPNADSVAGEGVIQGSLVLFKLKEDDLQNRPLTLKIGGGGGGPSQSVELDL
jgi:hypothetical protein